jgi:hypothetical protein
MLYRFCDLDQQRLRLRGALLVISLPGPLQLSEVVGIAQGMDTLVTVVGLPVIMAQNTLEDGQNAHLIHGLDAPLGMGIEQRH